MCNFPADEQVEVEGVGADGNTVKVRNGSDFSGSCLLRLCRPHVLRFLVFGASTNIILYQSPDVVSRREIVQ